VTPSFVMDSSARVRKEEAKIKIIMRKTIEELV
jgi:hypothetical protein